MSMISKSRSFDPLARQGDDLADAPLFQLREVQPARRVAETSLRAHRARDRGGDRQQVLELLLREPLTLDQISETLNRPPHALSPRLTELRKAGLIEKTGATRPTRSGCPAAVWSATAAALSAGDSDLIAERSNQQET